MSHDIFFKHSRRNWSRGSNSDLPTAVAVSGSDATKKLAIGTMALGTLTGLAFITAPWWKPLPEQPRRASVPRKRVRLIQIHPSTRITWSRH